MAFYVENYVTIQNNTDPEIMGRAMFRKYDEDGNGTLDVDEFVGAMRELGLGTTEEDAQIIFGSFDHDGGGTIDIDEFMEAYMDQWRQKKESDEHAATHDYIAGRDD